MIRIASYLSVYYKCVGSFAIRYFYGGIAHRNALLTCQDICDKWGDIRIFTTVLFACSIS